MYARLSCALVLALALTAAALPGGRGKDDAKKLEGTWTLIRGEDQGKEVPKDKLRGQLVVISKKTIIANDKDNKKVFVMSYKLDPSQKPAAIDMTIVEGSQKGQTAKGIYAFEKDLLKLAYAFAGDRPTTFVTKEGDKHLSFVLKRIQP
jgi:uncharacterized protein (TIGR03067 family)